MTKNKVKLSEHKLFGKGRTANITKRQKFGALTVLITLALLATQLVSEIELQFPLAAALAVSVSIGVFVVFRGEIQGFRKISLVFLISFYTGAVAAFYFLLPVRWLTRVPTAILFGIGFYAILLTENIYNVATGRSIQLLRAARSIGLLMTVLTLFLLFETLLSLRLPFWLNGVFVFFISFPLAYQNLWAMRLTTKIDNRLIYQSLFLGLAVAEVNLGLSFWPTESVLHALFLSTLFYTIVGIAQQNIAERLFKSTVKEYLTVIIIVFLFVILTTSWGGG